MLMDIPLHDRWRFLQVVQLRVPQYRLPRITQPGDTDRQAKLKRTLPIIHTQIQLLASDDLYEAPL